MTCTHSYSQEEIDRAMSRLYSKEEFAEIQRKRANAQKEEKETSLGLDQLGG